MIKSISSIIGGAMLAITFCVQAQELKVLSKQKIDKSTNDIVLSRDDIISAQARVKNDKELDAYRKRQIAGGLILELDARLAKVQPYVRSMLNSCGYTLVTPHRFAKRVYSTLVINGEMFNNNSVAEYSVMLDLLVALNTRTREVKAREKMRSYRTSEIDTHRALFAAFEDIGAQLKSGGFCLSR